MNKNNKDNNKIESFSSKCKRKDKKMFAEAIMDFCQVLFKVNNNIYKYLYIIYIHIQCKGIDTHKHPHTSKIKQCTEFYCIDTHTYHKRRNYLFTVI